MAATDTSSSAPPVSTPPVPPAGAPSDPGSRQPPVPPTIAAVLAGLTALTGAVIGLMTSFNAVHWTSAQTTLVATEVAAFWALAGAVTAHLWPQTKQQPVAVAGTVTAFVSSTLALGIGFAWWQLTGGVDDEVSVAAMISPLAGIDRSARQKPVGASLMRIAACRAGLTEERSHLRGTWLPGAQNGGLVHAHVFNEPEACHWILIHVAGTLRAVHRGLS